MAENPLSVGSPYVRQIKETSYEQDVSGHYTELTELPGFLELCVDVEGVPWVIARRKAPGLLADIARVKAATPPPEPAEPSTTPPPGV